MLNKNKLLEIISKSIKVNKKKININSSKEDFKNWDSLAHLKILTEIDKHTNGKASEINNLAEQTKISNLYKILIKKKLAK